SEFVAPIHEHAAGARVGQCLEWTVAEFLFDLRDLLDVVGARPIAQAEKILALLIALQQAQQSPLGRNNLGSDRRVVARDKFGASRLRSSTICPERTDRSSSFSDGPRCSKRK